MVLIVTKILDIKCMSQFPESAFSLPRSITDTETGEPVLAAPSFSGSLVSVGCGSEEWVSVRRI